MILFFLAIDIRQEGEVIIFQIHSQASLVWGSLLSCSMTLIKFKFPLYHLLNGLTATLCLQYYQEN